jgi:hypothetical protein
MRVLRIIPALLLWLALPAMARDHTLPAVESATSYPAVEVHPKEQVAIAVEPYDTKEKESIFRVDYLSLGVMPVRLIVTNLGDRPISLRDARILFETRAGDRIQAAEPEDVDRMMNPHEPHGAMPMPSPIPGIHIRHGNNYKKIEADFDAFEYQALVVEPHTTQAGFLFYDVSGLDHPLEGAHLYLRELRNADGHELFSFEIPFDKYLQAK